MARARARRRELRYYSSRYAFDDALQPRKPDNTRVIYPDAFYQVDDHDLRRAVRVADLERRREVVLTSAKAQAASRSVTRATSALTAELSMIRGKGQDTWLGSVSRLTDSDHVVHKSDQRRQACCP